MLCLQGAVLHMGWNDCCPVWEDTRGSQQIGSSSTQLCKRRCAPAERSPGSPATVLRHRGHILRASRLQTRSVNIFFSHAGITVTDDDISSLLPNCLHPSQICMEDSIDPPQSAIPVTEKEASTWSCMLNKLAATERGWRYPHRDLTRCCESWRKRPWSRDEKNCLCRGS